MFSMKIGGSTKKPKPKKSTTFTFNPPNKTESAKPKSSTALSNVFGIPDAEQESSSQPTFTQQSLNRAAKRKKTQRELAKVVHDDPSVFQYDELYDSFQQQRDSAFREKEIEKTLRPVRYLDTIQKVAEKRQIRYDAARERLLLKERKSTDHLFEDKQKYITRAYREKLKEIEGQRLRDKEQEKKELTVRDEKGMNSFFNEYLQSRTGGAKKDDRHGMEQRKKRDRVKEEEDGQSERSRSRSRSRERGKSGVGKEQGVKVMSEEERYHIERYQQELKKKTFDDEKRREKESLAKRKCEKRTTKSDVEKLRERYLKRKQSKK